MKRSRSPRTPSNLPTSVNRQLNSYVLAAGAAGVSLLVLAPPLQAEVVYTPANVTIGRDGSYKLDLNHDGIVDFIIVEHAYKDGSFATNQLMSVRAPIGNQVNCPSTFCISSFIYAAALRQGSRIGASQSRRGWLAQGAPMAFEELAPHGFVYYADAWVNVSDRYLGLKFDIGGETHYGWARLSVRFHPGLPKNRTWEALLTGYAYETVAGKEITAGQTQGSDNDEDASGASPSTRPSDPTQFAALGSLALGANGIPLWRREEIENGGKLESR